MTNKERDIRELARRMVIRVQQARRVSPTDEIAVLLADALATRERETWEAAANYATECEAVATDRMEILAWHKIAYKCRALAQEAGHE